MVEPIELFKKHLSDIIQIDDDSFDLVKPHLKSIQLKKGEFFAEESKVCRMVGFTFKGLLRIFYTKEGIEVNTTFCLENSMVCSFSSLVNETASDVSIQALEDSDVLVMSRTDLLSLYNRSNTLQNLGRLLVEKECIRLSDRLASLSFESAKEKYSKLLIENPDIVRRVPIQHIASYIGVSRETLSRIRSQIR